MDLTNPLMFVTLLLGSPFMLVGLLFIIGKSVELFWKTMLFLTMHILMFLRFLTKTFIKNNDLKSKILKDVDETISNSKRVLKGEEV